MTENSKISLLYFPKGLSGNFYIVFFLFVFYDFDAYKQKTFL